MSISKELLFKELDIINENIRFWHNLLIVLLSGLGALPFLFSQNRLMLNWTLGSIIFAGIIAIIVIMTLIKYNHKKREKIFRKIERLTKCKRYSS